MKKLNCCYVRKKKEASSTSPELIAQVQWPSPFHLHLHLALLLTSSTYFFVCLHVRRALICKKKEEDDDEDLSWRKGEELPKRR